MFKKSPILGALGTVASLAVLGSTVPVAASPAHASTPCAVFLPSDPPPDAVRINLATTTSATASSTAAANRADAGR